MGSYDESGQLQEKYQRIISAKFRHIVGTKFHHKVSSSHNMLHDDARNQSFKLSHLQIVCQIFSTSSHHCFHFCSCYFKKLFALFVFLSSLDHLHIWFLGHCVLIFTSSSSHLFLFVFFSSSYLSSHLVYWFLGAHLYIVIFNFYINSLQQQVSINTMDITDEPTASFLVLLILLLQSLRFHVELPPSFSIFLPNVVVITDIEEIVIMSICLRHKITYRLGLLPTKLGH